LQSLLNPSYQPTIDPKYFPNTGDFAGKAPDSVLWATNYTRGAWFLNSAVSFATTDTWEGNYGGMWYVRLVSGNVSSGAYKLDTKTSGTGTGIISSPHKDGEIICALPGKFQYSDYSFLCWGDYPRGTVMNLKATPDAGSSFAGWSGSCSGIGVCTITMDRNHDVVAIFNTGSTVVQNPQNINFVPPSVQLKVGGSAAFSVSATSGLPVTIVVTTPSICSVSGNTIYGNTVGDCMMQLYQNGDSNWLAAPTLTTGLPVVSGTVLRMSQVINYSAPSSIVVGGVGNLTFNSSSGLPVTATTNSTCNLSGSVLHGISAGVCSIQLNQAGDSNYYPASTVTATVSIISAAKQNQTINMNVSPQSPVTVGTIVSVFGNASSGLPYQVTL
jgi:hypothetical protein